jgi:hypothetical protein
MGLGEDDSTLWLSRSSPLGCTMKLGCPSKSAQRSLGFRVMVLQQRIEKIAMKHEGWATG